MPLRSPLVGVQNDFFKIAIPGIIILILVSYFLGQKWFRKNDILQNPGGFVL